jgi:tagaturonate reductase
MARAQGFDLIVRGLVDGRPVDIRKTCRSVREAFHAASDWRAVRERVRGPVQVIVSNTGDSGWTLVPADGAALLAEEAAAPASFPAKLLVLLHDRWQTQPGAELTLLPCELVSRNGDRLREIVVQLASEWRCAPAFVDWLQAHVVWASSLVDRIVSEALQPVGAVAEPYALWAIESQPRLQLPCRHPAIVLTDNLASFEQLKLFLLNLGHTLLADLWIRGRLAPDMTVLQAMQDPALRDLLEEVWQQEVLPVFDALGQGAQARSYLAGLRDRLLNPFLAHRLADIAQNHEQKKARRLQPLVELAQRHVPQLPQPRLRHALAAR